MAKTFRSYIPQPMKRAYLRTQHGFRLLTCSMRLLPDFIGLGTQKGGSTSLFNYLASHPYVMPACRKEVHFYDFNFHKGMAWYKAHFPTTLSSLCFKTCRNRNFITGEATPYYMIHPHVPRRVFQALPKVKLIAVLRNPVDRSYSHYNGEVEPGYETLPSFEEAIDKEDERLCGEYEKLIDDENYYSYNHHHYSYLARGVYVDQLARWFEYFPEKQLLILSSEELRTNTSDVFGKVQEFLGLPHWEPSEFKKHLARKYSNKMDPSTRKRLIEYFEPHNKRLYGLLKRTFDWDR